MILFQDLCEVGERVCEVKGTTGRRILYEFIQRSKEGLEFDEFYIFIRLVLPQLDDVRKSFGLKEVLLGKIYSELLSLNDTEMKRLRYYKDPNKALANINTPKGIQVGNFPSVLYYTLASRLSCTESSMTMVQVNEWLDLLWGSQDDNKRRYELFQRIINECPPLHHKWIVKLVLKNLEFSIGYETILKMIHPTGAELYNSNGQLRLTLEEVWSKTTPASLPLAGGVTRNPKPMLAKAVSLEQVPNTCRSLVDGSMTAVAIEPKLDGERLLCRYKRASEDDDVELLLYTRSGNSDYPSMYIPYLKTFFDGAISST
ncbi:DNA ligase [Gregarina niphandrodes]|uniref:DNA ligase n=1 Tax=Gregarina niphandrodes TaxID=110365 RepID=A0A023B347_GRENI|nr:DNA ligase [Gregarina niphandrodes]EZG55314.1 DNA ligase [Gregarina niphandrodes]|eukprot:XP_011131648.1 DNA ligase [Gregarina niphandrodes]